MSDISVTYQQGLEQIKRYRELHACIFRYAEQFIINQAGNSWYIQDMGDDLNLSLVVFADIPETHRKKMLKAIDKSPATFVQEYCIDDATQLYIRAYEVAKTEMWVPFYVKVMIPKPLKG